MNYDKDKDGNEGLNLVCIGGPRDRQLLFCRKGANSVLYFYKKDKSAPTENHIYHPEFLGFGQSVAARFLRYESLSLGEAVGRLVAAYGFVNEPYSALATKYTEKTK